jgi:hypothetical protein
MSAEKRTKQKTDGLQEEPERYAVPEIRALTQKFESLPYFRPESLVYMLETFYLVDRVRAAFAPQTVPRQIQRELRPMMLNIASTYVGALEDQISEHIERFFEDVYMGGGYYVKKIEQFIEEIPKFRKQLEVEKITHRREVINSPDYKKRLKDLIERYEDWGIEKDLLDIKEEVYLEMNEEAGYNPYHEVVKKMDFSDFTSEWWGNPNHSEDQFVRQWMIDVYEDDLRVDKWFQCWDFIHGIRQYFKFNDPAPLQQYKKRYKVRFDIRSEFDLFSNLEEFIRNLEHHHSTIIGEVFDSFGYLDLSDDFFSALDEWDPRAPKRSKQRVMKILAKIR